MNDARPRSRSSAIAGRGVLIAVLAGVGYYVGGLIGLELRLPPATSSVLWPANAILTAALLLSPPRWWALCVLAAFPAHLVAELQTDWPLSLILALFFTNCSEALLAAAGMWLLGELPVRFDTLRRLAVFLAVVAISAPLLSTFIDAAAVAWFRHESYWIVWRGRLTGNVLAQLTVVPALVGIARGVPRWIRRGSLFRYAEAIVLVTGLLVSGLLTFAQRLETSALLAVPAQMPLAAQLPFLLWAAVRFGTTGTGPALLVTTLVAAFSVSHGYGPFVELSAETAVLALQLGLILVAVTVLGLATLMEERRETQQALAERLRFEELLSRLSGAFVQVPSSDMTGAFEVWLERVGRLLQVECLRLFQVTATGVTMVSAWAAPEFRGILSTVVEREYPWILRQVLDQRSVAVERLDTMPAEAAHDRASLESHGYKSVLVAPLLAGDRLLGAAAFGTTVVRRWPDALVANLRLICEVFANALARKQIEDERTASEAMKSAILDSLTSGVAVIDRAGGVLSVNDTWTQLAAESSDVACTHIGIGENLLDTYRSGELHDTPRLTQVLEGLQGVLAGSPERFVFEHVSQPAEGERWWRTVATRLKVDAGGALITCTEITERRRAELEAQRSRQELAHVTRVATMGELTSSLAHQLNQPLAAIMSNAQAGRRLLDVPSPDLSELRAILGDIVDDDRRASDVIHGLRGLLKKTEPAMDSVEMNAIVRDIARLVASDAVIRNVTVTLGPHACEVFVRGDRVQLQQVVLNLLMNAMEALTPDIADRSVAVSCSATDQTVEVSVRDTGVGLQQGTESLAFEPFYSTKPGGLGMGLSIARSIVEAHGGSIGARNETPGTLVWFTLPLDGRREAGSASSGREQNATSPTS